MTDTEHGPHHAPHTGGPSGGGAGGGHAGDPYGGDPYGGDPYGGRAPGGAVPGGAAQGGAAPGGAVPGGAAYSGTAAGGQKGLLAVLFDLNFERSITARLVRLFYFLSIVLSTCSSLVLLAFGVWMVPRGWLLGLAMILATPFFWVAQIVMVRLLLEFVINQFRITEELQAIRHKGQIR
jgi:hypothetical protein